MSAILQDQNKTIPAWLHHQFSLYKEGLNGERNHPITHFRQAAFDELQTLEFPTRRDEDWKYTNFSRILQEKFQGGEAITLQKESIQPHSFPQIDAIQLVFVNGILQELPTQLALPEEVRILRVTEALRDAELKDWIDAQIKEEGGTGRNTFLPLNRAFAMHGILVDVDRNYRLDRPIHLVHISAPGEVPHIAHPQLFVRAKGSSEVTVIESYGATNDERTYFNNTANYFELQANARVYHYRLQTEGREAYQVNNTIVTQDRDSVYTSYAVDLGGRMVRNNLSSRLRASGTDTHFYGVYLGNGSQHIDNQTFIDHAMPHCESNELYKGILTDKARGVFNGKVMVRQDAQKTNAFQQNSSLVLSPNAIMDAKPQLEIYADDVKCSHGATIGQLDESAVFYLRSRGLSVLEARNLLQQAFLGEVLDNMKIEVIRDRMHAMIEEKLRG